MKRILGPGLLLIQCCLGQLQAYAQKSFTEGTLSYALTISPGTANTTDAPIDGQLQITIKEDKLSKELRIGSGMKNLFVVRTQENLAFSLLHTNNKKYAIEFNAAELKKRRQHCDKVKIEQQQEESRTIAGFKVSKATVRCGQDALTVYYTREWKISNDFIFEELPGFEYLPLSFDITDPASGRLLHYELKTCTPEPIDESTFRIPRDHKIITEKEYQQLSR